MSTEAPGRVRVVRERGRIKVAGAVGITGPPGPAVSGGGITEETDPIATPLVEAEAITRAAADAAEATARANADTAEEGARKAADATEKAAREKGDADERTGREEADATLTAAAAAAKTIADAALPKAGGTMVGDIVLKGDPTANLNPATKQWVEGKIAALINGAPGALDTLKEIADKLGSDEAAVEALTSAVTGKLGATANLSDLANVVTARGNLGLGSAATHPAGDFDLAGAAAAAQAASQPVDSDLTAIAALTTTEYGRSFLALATAAAGRTLLGLGTAATQASGAFDAAGAAAAAQAASQPLDADLTAIAALATTTFGRSLLEAANAAAVRTAIETNSMAQFDALERRGLLEKEHFGLSTPTGVTTFAVVANAMRATRFVPLRDMVVRGLSWVVSVAASVDDPCAIAMLDTNGKTKLAASGSVSGKMNATGRKDVDFTADVNLTAGHVYYPAHQNGTIGGTAATVMAWAMANAFMSAIIGEGSGNFLGEGGTPTFPFATEPAPTSQGTPTLLIVRER